MNKGIESDPSHYQYTSMLRFLPAILLSFIAFNLSSCQSLTNQAMMWAKNPNFSSPENCARNYFAALTTNNPKLEYQCFGKDLKKRYQATLDTYIIARPELVKQLGVAAKYAFNLNLIKKEFINEDQATLWWGLNSKKALFGMLIKRQYYWTLKTDQGEYGALIPQPPKKYVYLNGTKMNADIDDPILRSINAQATIKSLYIGYEWKIADFLEIIES